MTTRVRTILKVLLCAIVAIGCLMADYYTELGVASGITYIFLVMTAALFKEVRIVLLLAVVSTVLILVGWQLSPSGGEFWKVGLNRLYSLIAIWAFAIELFYHLRTRSTDYLEKTKVEALSLELRQQLDTLNAAAIVSITDRNGNITFVNELFCKISKYSKEELIGKNHRVLKSDVHSDGLFKGMWFAIMSGRTWTGDICNLAKDGTKYWVATTIAPFYNNDNEIDKFVSIRFDITEQKTMALKLEVQAKSLAENNRKLEKANRELQTFSYSVSHDLKAPLRALQGFSDALFNEYHDQFDDRGKRWLKFVKSNAERMDQLIADILIFSRISKSEIRYSKLIMNETIEELFNQERVNYANIINLKVGELPDPYGDRTMLKFVWQNLIGNAIKYSSLKDEIEIEISGHEDEDFYYYKIKDNGAGFDMRHYDKLFGVFQRLHGNNEFNGTGVGLANVQQIIEKHGGEIKANSEVDKGATFEFTVLKKQEYEQI